MAKAVKEQGIKVVLTGEGADEHFLGYPTYHPDALAEIDPSYPASSITQADRTERLEALHQALQHTAPPDAVEYTERMLNHSWNAREVADSCLLPFSPWTDVYSTIHPLTALAETFDGRTRDLIVNKWHPLHTAEYMSIKTSLPTYILRHAGDNVDMMHQVESRPPFLDHHVADYINGVPPSLKLLFNPIEKTFREKYILREAMRPFLTTEVYASRKKSYLAPSKYKANGPIHQLFTRLVTKENVDNLGFVDWERTKGHLDKAFGDIEDELAFRITLSVAQYVVLSQKFRVPRAQDITKRNGFQCRDL